MKCSKCESAIFAYANERYKLCVPCNWSRLHNGKDYATEMRKKQKEYQIKALERQKAKMLTTPPKKKIPIPQRSLKGAEKTERVSKIKKELTLQAFEEGNYYCWGCGETGGLDRSHILSVGQRPDLAEDKNNINLLCRKCHNVWEDFEPLKVINLHSFEKDMQFVYLHDQETFQKYLFRLLDAFEETKNKKLLKIIKQIETWNMNM